ASSAQRLRALTLVTLFLTFDLVMFGAFTRLTDSGLGCPDWPGCYGNASPLGAHLEITAAQTAMPSGPVTHDKAWIEMLHRYWASSVGALILVLTAMSWWLATGARKTRVGTVGLPNPWWATFTLVWVCIQGAFGALTVTMKLFPAIVSLHLLGGYVLLALLTVQAVQWTQHSRGTQRIGVGQGLHRWMLLGVVMLVIQAASGAWVSTNYAVLACTEFPQCQGQWWPDMSFAQGFTLWRGLGMAADGAYLPFSALTAIHVVHRMLALLTVLILGGLYAALWRTRKFLFLSRALLGVLVLQIATGVSNAVLDWPLPAAVLHTGGAGALVIILVALLTTSVTLTPKLNSS
ncbi:MAG: COX15/CtaA family protein, partial [Candidatus Saccharibacteria bacterium]|nr:COX15/CtaA family protein [Rhodoferax sp.]